MADLKISQLPLFPATGDTTGFYVVANNVGETITYKMTKETLIGASGTSGSSGSSGTSGTSGLSGTSGSSGSSGTSGLSGSSGSSGTSGLSGSSGSSGTSGLSGTSGSSGSSGTSGTDGDAFFLESNTTNSFVNDWYSSGATNGAQQFIIGGSGNTITHQGQTEAIINSEGCIIRDPGEVGYIKTIIGAENSTIQGGAIGVGIFGGRNNLNYAGDGCSIYGGSSNQITGGQNNAIVGGTGCSIPGAQSSFIAGCDYTSIGNGVKNVALASESGAWQNDMRSSAMIGSYASVFQSPGQHSIFMSSNGNLTTGSYTERAFMTGNANTINAADSNVNNTLVGSDNSTIYVVDNADNNNLIHASSYSVISGKTRASMISTSGSTALYDDTLHSDNLHSFGQISQGVQSLGSGDTFSIDWNNGGIVEMTLTDDATCSMTNVRNGATYMVYITTTGTQTITPSASGYTFKYEGGGFTLTNTGTDLCVLDVVGTNIYVRHFANFS